METGSAPRTMHQTMVAAIRAAMSELGGTVIGPGHPTVLAALVVIAYERPLDALGNRSDNCPAAIMDLSAEASRRLWAIDGALALVRGLCAGQPLDELCAAADAVWTKHVGWWTRWRAKRQVAQARRILTERGVAWARN